MHAHPRVKRLPSISVQGPAATRQKHTGMRRSTSLSPYRELKSPSSEEEPTVFMPSVSRTDRTKPSSGHKPLRKARTLGELGPNHIRSSAPKTHSLVTSPLSPVTPGLGGADERTPTPVDIQEGVTRAFGKRLTAGDVMPIAQLPPQSNGPLANNSQGARKSRRNSVDEVIVLRGGRKPSASGRASMFATGMREMQSRLPHTRPLSLQEDDTATFSTMTPQPNLARRRSIKRNTFFQDGQESEARPPSLPPHGHLSPTHDVSALPSILPRSTMSAFRPSSTRGQMPSLSTRPHTTASTPLPGFVVTFDDFSDLPADHILLEVEGVMQDLHADSTDLCGSYGLRCTIQDVAMEICVVQDPSGSSSLQFTHASASSTHHRFRQVCCQVVDALRAR